MTRSKYVDDFDNYILELERLKFSNPKLAKALAIEGLIRTGVVDGFGNLKSPYNGVLVSENDFSMGPKYDSNCDFPQTVVELVEDISKVDKPKKYVRKK